MKKFKEWVAPVNENQDAPLEITELNLPPSRKDQKLLYRLWPEGLTYRGMDLFPLYIDKMIPHAERVMRQTRGVDPDFMQECYFGYHVEKDVFIVGFDVFVDGDAEEEELTANGEPLAEVPNAVSFRVDENGRINTNGRGIDLGLPAGGELFFYDRGGTYDWIQQNLSGVLHLRLD